MVNFEENHGPSANEAFGENYPPRLRAVILFSSLVGSWGLVAVAAYVVSRFI